jgi:hypothetical protein
MGGKIDLYYDCVCTTVECKAEKLLTVHSQVSPYSWYALVYLIQNREALKANGVDFE